MFVISGLHYAVTEQAVVAHEILRRLYYVPIVAAAVLWGLRGGVATSLLATALYLPHIVTRGGVWPVFDADRYGELVLFNAVGIVTGLLADRLWSERNRYRNASEELETAYARLQASIGKQLEAERMATVGQIAAGMAHEIRTPLSALLGCCEILGADYPPGHPKAEFLEIVKKEIARLESVVAAFLEFAQLAPPSPLMVDLNEIAESVLHLVAPARRARGSSKIETQLSHEPCAINADKSQVERALADLLLTGFSLAQDGSVTVSTAVHGSNAELAVWVTPFTQTVPSDLFEPFAAALVPHGLALPIVKRLIENQGGHVRAETANGGIRFVVELPRPSDDVVTPDSKRPASGSQGDARAESSGFQAIRSARAAIEGYGTS